MKRTLYAGIVFCAIVASAHASNEELAAVKVKPDAGSVALTFDDGPNPKMTPKVLAILKQYNIKATFFVLGQCAKQYPELIKQIDKEGHVIANHSYSHPMLTHLSSSAISKQLANTDAAVVAAINKKPKCIRPPYGNTNKQVRALAEKEGLVLVTWDLNSFDYERRGVSALTNWTLKQTHPGYTILMHDGSDNMQTLIALPKIIEGLQQRGIKYDTICS